MTPRRWVPLASGAQMLALGAGAITNILYARLLPTAVIGEFVLLIALATVLVALADSGLGLLLTRELAQHSREPSEVIGVLVVAFPIVLLILWLAFYGGSIIIHAVWNSHGIAWTHALMVLEFALSFGIFQVTLTLCQGLGLFRRRSAAVAANGVFTAVLTAAWLRISPSLSSAIHATVVAWVGVALITLYPIVMGTGVDVPRVTRVWELMRSARPIWANTLIGYAGGTADVLLAATVLPLAAVGYYGIFKAIATVFLAPFTTLLPLIYVRFSSVTRVAQAQLYTKLRLSVVGAIIALLVISAPVFSWAIGITFGERFSTRPAVLLAMIIAGGLAFSHNLLGYVATANGLFRIPLMINGAVAIVFWSTAPVLGKHLGLSGFVAATMTANIVGLITAAYRTRSLVSTRAGTLALWPICTFAGAMMLALWLWRMPTALGVPISFALAAVWSLAILAAVKARQQVLGEVSARSRSVI